MESNNRKLAEKAIAEIQGLSKVYIGKEKPNAPAHVFEGLKLNVDTFHWTAQVEIPTDEVQNQIDDFLTRHTENMDSMFWLDSVRYPFPFDEKEVLSKKVVVSQND